MTWGLPPKYKTTINFNERSVQEVKEMISKVFSNEKFCLIKEEGYSLSFKKKLGLSFLSLFSFAKPVIEVFILITKKGRVTIESKYDYNSPVGSAFNDGGKQKKIISTIVGKIEEEKGLMKRTTVNLDNVIEPKGIRNQTDQYIN